MSYENESVALTVDYNGQGRYSLKSSDGVIDLNKDFLVYLIMLCKKFILEGVNDLYSS